MKIAIAVVGGLIALGLLTDLAGSAGNLGDLAGIGARAVSDMQTGFLAVLGLVVLVFAVIERASTPRWASQDDWHPHDLPPLIKNVDQLDRGRTIAGLALSGIALVLINLYPEWLRVRVFSNGDEFSYPLLGTVPGIDVVILSAYLAVGVVLGAVVLARGRWEVGTRVVDATASAILVLLLSRLWSRADQLLPGQSALVEAGWPAEQAADFGSWLTEPCPQPCGGSSWLGSS